MDVIVESLVRRRWPGVEDLELVLAGQLDIATDFIYLENIRGDVRVPRMLVTAVQCLAIWGCLIEVVRMAWRHLVVNSKAVNRNYGGNNVRVGKPSPRLLFAWWAALLHSAPQVALLAYVENSRNTFGSGGSFTIAAFLSLAIACINLFLAQWYMLKALGYPCLPTCCVVLANYTVDDSAGQTLLHDAAGSGDLPLVKHLLYRCKARIDARNLRGQTPLHIAAGAPEDVKGALACVSFLMSAGADVGAMDMEGRTPLAVAAALGTEATIKCLVTDGKAEIHTTDNAGMTPLHLAVWHGHAANTRVLIGFGGANVNAVDYLGRTALHWCLWTDREDLAKTLVGAGADVNCADSQGKTLLHIAAESSSPALSHVALATVLVDSLGADPNKRDRHRRTPLMLAMGAKARDEALVAFLADRTAPGGDANSRAGALSAAPSAPGTQAPSRVPSRAPSRAGSRAGDADGKAPAKTAPTVDAGSSRRVAPAGWPSHAASEDAGGDSDGGSSRHAAPKSCYSSQDLRGSRGEEESPPRPPRPRAASSLRTHLLQAQIRASGLAGAAAPDGSEAASVSRIAVAPAVVPRESSAASVAQTFASSSSRRPSLVSCDGDSGRGLGADVASGSGAEGSPGSRPGSRRGSQASGWLSRMLSQRRVADEGMALSEAEGSPRPGGLALAMTSWEFKGGLGGPVCGVGGGSAGKGGSRKGSSGVEAAAGTRRGGEKAGSSGQATDRSDGDGSGEVDGAARGLTVRNESAAEGDRPGEAAPRAPAGSASALTAALLSREVAPIGAAEGLRPWTREGAPGPAVVPAALVASAQSSQASGNEELEKLESVYGSVGAYSGLGSMVEGEGAGDGGADGLSSLLGSEYEGAEEGAWPGGAAESDASAGEPGPEVPQGAGQEGGGGKKPKKKRSKKRLARKASKKQPATEAGERRPGKSPSRKRGQLSKGPTPKKGELETAAGQPRAPVSKRPTPSKSDMDRAARG